MERDKQIEDRLDPRQERGERVHEKEKKTKRQELRWRGADCHASSVLTTTPLAPQDEERKEASKEIPSAGAVLPLIFFCPSYTLLLHERPNVPD